MNANSLDALTFDQLVPSESKYLRKDDVGEDGMVLTIKGFRYESIKNDDGEEDKTIMYFVEDVKPMVLNKTNASLIPVVTGARTAGEAKGKKIVVYCDPTVSYGGRVTGGLRIKKIPGAPRQAPRPVAKPVEREPGSDDDLGEIPFNDDLPPM